ncbi:MAG TPA: DUF349 domain-containing protein, partial [Gammaproteobacteria bacterium]|nr:DUF349 domain-containing protein [Gammaproteobacteria bacterium]
MRLFQNLFKPKWKHNDPAIRKQAILALDVAENQATLTEIASHDKNIDLRLLALKRITDFDYIIQSATSNTNDRVKELANKLIKQTLSGQLDSGLDETQKIQKIQKIGNQKLIEYIAENGSTSKLRKSAIENISREALLGDLAISDKDSDIRMTAAQKLSQKSTLERVYRATKTKDKKVSRIAKERLDQLIREAEKPAKTLAAQKAICNGIENLGKKGLWQREKQQFDNYLKQWAELNAEAPPALKERLEQAKTQFTQAYDSYLARQEARLAQEASYLPIKNQKIAIIKQIQNTISLLDKQSELDEPTLSDMQQSTLKQKQTWGKIETLPEEIENEIGQQYQDVLKSLEQKIEQRLHNISIADSLNNLQRKINDYIKHPDKLSPTIISKFEKQWEELPLLHASEDFAKIRQELKNKINRACDLLAEQQQRRDKLSSEIKTQLHEMESHLSNGILSQAIGLRNNIQNSLLELEKHGIKGLQEFKNRLNKASAKINELNNWRTWANTPQKEQLISNVESLIDSDLDPKEIAYIVSHARKEWKKLGPSEKGRSQELWEKFQAACDKAYEPCKAYFEEEKKRHVEHYAKRITFLESLEAFLKQADWDNVDWKKVETLFRHARKDWNNLGPVDHKKRKNLNKRFNALHNQLKTALNREWQKNTAVKAKIVEEALALENEENLPSAIQEAKALQQRWKTAGRIQHAKERELWQQFKQACDSIFARRDDLNKQKSEEIKQRIDEKNEIVSKIESLCNQAVEKIENSTSELKQLQSEFNNFGHTTAESDAAFNKRVATALHLYERKQESISKRKVIHDLMLLKEKASICTELEQAIETKQEDIIEGAAQKMASIQAPSQTDWHQRINQRFQNSLAIAKQDDAMVHLSQAAKKNLEQMALTAVQLEIIADIDTPASAADERLKAQAQRLADKLQNRAEENKWESFLVTEINWLT